MNTVRANDKESGWRNWFRGPRNDRASAGEQALIAAQGKAMAALATALQSSGHLDARRFSAMLALFSAVVAEEDKLQGSILAIWADILEQSLDAAGVASA